MQILLALRKESKLGFAILPTLLWFLHKLWDCIVSVIFNERGEPTTSYR